MIEIINNRTMDNNTYLIINDHDVVIIDPSCNDGRIENKIRDYHLQAILLTHGHYDHLSDCNHLHRLYPDVAFYCHENDFDLAYGRDIIFNQQPPYIIQQDLKLTPLQESHYDFGSIGVDAYWTPGHSGGCMTFKYEQNLFTGDLLFAGSIGRTDFPQSDNRAMIQSLKRLKQFDKQCKVYPGHGPDSTLGYELANNPYLLHYCK